MMTVSMWKLDSDGWRAGKFPKEIIVRVEAVRLSGDKPDTLLVYSYWGITEIDLTKFDVEVSVRAF